MGHQRIEQFGLVASRQSHACYRVDARSSAVTDQPCTTRDPTTFAPLAVINPGAHVSPVTSMGKGS